MNTRWRLSFGLQKKEIVLSNSTIGIRAPKKGPDRGEKKRETQSDCEKSERKKLGKTLGKH